MKTTKANRGGRPVTTRSKSTQQVAYRVSAEQRAELEEEGKRLGLGANAVAKLRAFPRKLVAILALAAALALSACDAGEMPNSPDVRGAAGASGAAGMDGTAGMTGAAGADYVPDPAPTCGQPPTTDNGLYACDLGGGDRPTFNASGTQCYSCPGWPVPEAGCAIRLPWSLINGTPVDDHPHDIFCPFNPCDPTLCHEK